MVRLCESEEARLNEVQNVFAQTSDSEEELEGAEIVQKDEKVKETEVNHLTDKMKELVVKYPETLNDDLHNCPAFSNVPHQEIEMDPDVVPVSHSYVRNTPIHLREMSRGFIQNLVDQDIISPQAK